MDKHIITNDQFDEFIIHQLKNSGLREETCNLIDLREIGPGYYYRSSDMDIYLLLQCRQAATDPLACGICFVQYCRRCLVTMINAKKSEDWETKVEMTGSPIDQPFYCTNNCKGAKAIFYLAEDIKDIDNKMFKCPSVKCNQTDRWTKMANHVLKCRIGNDYEVNIAEWGCEFMLKFEKPYEIMKGWEKFVESEFEREITVSKITFPEPLAVTKEVEAPKIPKTTTTAGYYISARGNLHHIDSESESDEEIYVTTGLGKRIPSEIEVATTSKGELTGLKTSEIVIFPTKHESEERREDALKRKRRKSEKYLESRKRRRAQKQLNQRELLLKKLDQRVDFTTHETIKK